MNVAEFLERAARRRPEAPAVYEGERLVASYGALALRSRAIAGYLLGHLGLSPGARVALFMGNSVAYLEILYGIWAAGCVAVPINAKLHALEAAFAIADSGASAIFVSDDLKATLAAALSAAKTTRELIVPGGADYERALKAAPLAEPVPRAPDDVAWLFYTSGTTGKPKGVMLTHRNLVAMTLAYFADVDTVEATGAIVYAAPFSHGAGLYNFTHMLRGARHVVPLSGGFDPEELVQLARAHGEVSMFAAPTMVQRLVEHVAATGADASGFKTIVYGGGPMYVEHIRRALAVMGSRFVQIYGQGESPMTITALSRADLADQAHPRYAERIASVGMAHSVVEVRVVDEAGKPLPPDTTGEVIVRGDTVMAGYWRNPEATAATLRDGWLMTGDVGSLDADGYLTLKDRSKDVIITGGSNVYPREVEEVLLAHPGVAEVSVVGRKDAEWGEAIVAFVVRAQGSPVDAAALDALCLERIARFKRPKVYRFVEALPKNNYGKVLKTELRKILDAE